MNIQKRHGALIKNGNIAIRLLLTNAGYIPIAFHAVRELKKDTIKNFDENSYDSIWSKNSEDLDDVLGRANWLCSHVIVNPSDLIKLMPDIIGRQYQGQWAIYACSMTAFALVNIIRMTPTLTNKYLGSVSALIEMVLSPEIRYYDTMQWKEDALRSLAGNRSHMTYLSILAWMITNYRMAGGDDRYDDLLNDICYTLARRMGSSRDLNLPSFPNGIVFLPDMMFAVIALKNYGILNEGNYDNLVSDWLLRAKTDWIDKKTGLLISQYYPNGRRSTMYGSYAALNCSCLTMLDDEFAYSQYSLLKKYFGRLGRYCGIKEYLHKNPKWGFHIDAGPIIQGLSPTGTSFALGAATYFKDWNFRSGLLNMAELAGKTIIRGDKRHYKLSEIMLTGEAITLGMRTNYRV